MQGKEKIKKVGILTLPGYFNYGNRLQAYAAEEVIKNLGFDSHILVIENIFSKPKNSKKNNILKLIIKLRKIPIKEICPRALNKIKRTIFLYINKGIIKEREEIFKDFSKTYLKEVFYNDTKKSLKNLSNNYDFFITGSDQVWNPFWTNSLYFLSFTNKDKRIAYAASFGVSDIPRRYNNLYKNWLSGMKNISVRETAGSQIVYNSIGKEVPVLIDPTLMLTKKQWFSISKRDTKRPEKNYILIYFLGEKTRQKYKKQIKKIIKYSNLEVVSIADLKDKERYKISPNEFIDYINSASLVLTDSYHGVIFSILMETPFIVFERTEGVKNSKSMFSRIETLLQKFKLESRKINGIELNNQIFDCDFSHVLPILKNEREKAIEYLKNALNIY
ncbi:MAG: polysaccharide pyruvyl transferase family protein [Candidatus Pacebacteria bacterium]|nr:polysaccharide pyruvyl transferase family protein [Candidatus Paceibacterota bacterium]